MRLYTFCNYYLSSIQQGIQTAHVVAELAMQDGSMFEEWAKYHKTIIVLNGGNNASLIETYEYLVGQLYPVAAFYEDRDSLNRTMTCVGVLLPELVWSEIDSYRKDNWFINRSSLSDSEVELVKFLSQFGLAR
jgi:hypothetical protein